MENYTLTTTLCEWRDDGSEVETRQRYYASLDVALDAYTRECKTAISYVRDPAYTTGDDHRGATVELVSNVSDGDAIAMLDI